MYKKITQIARKKIFSFFFINYRIKLKLSNVIDLPSRKDSKYQINMEYTPKQLGPTAYLVSYGVSL